MRSDAVNRLLLQIVPKLLFWLMRLWFGTCRVTAHNDENLPSGRAENENVLASFWHYSIIYILYYLRNYPATVMVSASSDGEYIARLAKEFGYNSVRGSRNHKGSEALKNMLRAVKSGDNGAVVADGSQGPARIAQPGALLVASKTGRPIVPMVWSASKYFTINSWDKTLVPKPFAHVDIYFGEPIYLPNKVSAEELEKYRCLLEDALNNLYRKAWFKYGIDAHERVVQ
ncbi:lysophospholipid acyltransferase family protein [Desulforhopalus sp. IMCC35007]|uniref:lysophospholipid acyltransferase family protein n=1 Tax=Desulforhopalus sp. IMCC35007 TaxID=2569543 RepID=UPI0010AEEA05|nr:lysophospholipid acyltransferase family protein [Desulforhopalus sp. IMCC35007]TKB09055.1 DUF374 domain-containing protein [Desulforhopalus sp. IMCC35007]